jgi:ribose 5-phosphate isomerase B
MKIAIGADHAGVTLKDDLAAWLRERGHEVVDHGTAGASSVDYPDFADRVSRAILGGEAERGLLVCGTGVGMAIAANRHRGIRAVNCSDVFTAKMSRGHNDANVLAIGARVVGAGLARELVEAFLGQAFEGGRHAGRVAKLG